MLLPNNKHIIYLLPVLACFCLSAAAQQDTTKKQQTIDITSAYKPVARNTAKINFSAVQYRGDTVKYLRPYEVPAQNLFYAYKPLTLKPLMLEQETGPVTGDRNVVKVGFGNYTTPFIRASAGIGDGEKYLLNFYGEFISSKSNQLKYQQFSRLDLGASGSYFLAGNELYGTAVIRRHNNYLYGYDQAVYDYKKQDVLQQFQELEFTAGFRNTDENALGVSYHPTVNVDLFSVKNKASEFNFLADVPVQKSINDHFTARVNMRADLSNYSTGSYVPGSYSFNNNLVIIAPSVDYFNNALNLRLGFSPAWNNGSFQMLPDVKGEFRFKEKLMLHAGWVGRIQKNSYRNLTRVNPFLEPVRELVKNTGETEYYGGLKAGIGKHFSFNASVGWITIRDMALFINDTSAGGKGFNLVNEEKASNLRIRGGASFVNKDKFTATAEIIVNGYTGFERKAWHTLPIELTADAAWWATKKLMLKTDLYLFAGGNYLAADNKSYDLGGGVDLSLGAEYRIKNNLKAWLDVNNLLNDKYERWHAYPVFGINLLGGIIINF